MNNGPIAGLISGCVIYLIFRLVAHVARVMFIGRQDRLNWELCMSGMYKELSLSRQRRNRRVNYLKYYGGTA